MDSSNEVDFSQRSLLRAVIIWGLSAFFYLYELTLLVSPSVMVEELIQTFHVSAEQLGSLAAYYYYAYAILQIPVGLLVDKFGPKKLLLLAGFFCSLGCFLFAKAESLWVAQTGRFVMGIGGAFAVVSCLKLAALWFPPKRFALLAGVMVAVGMMGAVFGQMPIALLMSKYGWRETILLGAAVGLVFSMVIFFVIVDTPFPQVKLSGVARPPIVKGLLEIGKMPQVWLVSLYAGLMFVPTTGFGQLWGVPYVTERFHIAKESAGWTVSMIFFGWAIGGPIFGWFSDTICRRKFPMQIAAIGVLVMMLLILYAPLSLVQMKGAIFLLGVFSSGFVLAFSVVREINSPLYTGVAIGFINTLNNASGALAQPVIGILLDQLWTGSLSSEGNPIYTVPIFNEAMLFLPVCIGIAFLVLFFVRETYCVTKT